MIAMMDHHLCYLCGLAEEKLAGRTCAAIGHFDSLILANKPVCSVCSHLLSHLDQYVSVNHVKYGDHSFSSPVLQNLKALEQAEQIDQVDEEIILPVTFPKMNSMIEKGNGFDERSRSQSDCRQLKRLKGKRGKSRLSYAAWLLKLIHQVINFINQENWTHLSVLPRSLLYFLAISSGPAPQERQHKLKQLLRTLALHHALSYSELREAAIVSTVLMCHMDSQKTGKILAKLSQMVARRSLSWKDIIGANLNHDKAIEIDKIWWSIQIIIQKSTLSEEQMSAFLSSLHSIPDLLSPAQFKQAITKISIEFPVSSLNAHLVPLSEFMSLKNERNSMELILLSLSHDEESIHAAFTALQTKHKKQKQEYITKIVKLNAIIDLLTKELEQLKLKEGQDNLPQPALQHREIEEVYPGEMKIQPGEMNTQPEMIKQEEITTESSDAITYLQSIITMTDVMSLNDKITHVVSSPRNSNRTSNGHHRASSLHHSNSVKKSMSSTVESPLPSNPQALCNRIIAEINAMQISLQKMLNKYRSSEDEKGRLLSIVTRKEQRFVELINEKDIIIEKYENALWKMENGQDVHEEGLKDRIQYICQVWARKKGEKVAQTEKAKVLQNGQTLSKSKKGSPNDGKAKTTRKKQKEDSSPVLDKKNPTKEKECLIY